MQTAITHEKLQQIIAGPNSLGHVMTSVLPLSSGAFLRVDAVVVSMRLITGFCIRRLMAPRL